MWCTPLCMVCVAAEARGSADARGHDPVVPRSLRRGVHRVDAREDRQVVRGECHAVRIAHRLLHIRPGAQEGQRNEGGWREDLDFSCT